MKIEIEIPDNPGFESAGVLRGLKKGEWFLDKCGNVTQAVRDTESLFIVMRRTANEMPASLHRALWGVIPGGYWIAWDKDLKCWWYEARPLKTNRRWAVNCSSGDLPRVIKKPEGIPWQESAMQMPEEPPETGLRKAAERVVEGYSCDGVSLSQAIETLREELGK